MDSFDSHWQVRIPSGSLNISASLPESSLIIYSAQMQCSPRQQSAVHNFFHLVAHEDDRGRNGMPQSDNPQSHHCVFELHFLKSLIKLNGALSRLTGQKHKSSFNHFRLQVKCGNNVYLQREAFYFTFFYFAAIYNFTTPLFPFIGGAGTQGLTSSAKYP